jgi:tripartite-type tricarboxylate transporter receptor subunit TctC
MNQKLFRNLCATLALTAAAAAPAFAQRVIHLVVPYGPGAVQDTVARTFSNELGQALNATVLVENRAGAGGTVGTAFVAHAPADGSTLVMAAASHMLAGHLYTKLSYHPLKDFVGVGYVGNSGYVIAAPANLGVNTLPDYIKLVKGKPGQFNYASAGNGSATHLGMAYFLSRAGLQMQHVPMKATGDAVNEVLAGRVQGVASATIGIAGFKSDPRIRLLAYTGEHRSKFLPELPTVAESGVPGFKFDSWFGVLGPATMPKAEVDKLNAALNKVLSDPVVQERLTRLGVEPGTLSVADFNKLLAADWETSGALVKASGARIE